MKWIRIDLKSRRGPFEVGGKEDSFQLRAEEWEHFHLIEQLIGVVMREMKCEWDSIRNDVIMWQSSMWMKYSIRVLVVIVTKWMITEMKGIKRLWSLESYEL